MHSLPDERPPDTKLKRSSIDQIFIGASGLRAGWRLLMYVGMFYFLLYAIAFITAPLSSRIPENALQQSYLLLISDAEQLVAAVIPAFVLARWERRPFSNYGLKRAGAFGKLFWTGVLWGVLSLTVLLIAMRIFGLFEFGSLAIRGARALRFALFWGVTFLIVALYEEFFTRGYTQFTLTDGIGFWQASLLLSAIFGASHLFNPGENWIGALGAAVIGLFWCLTLRRTGSLWFSIGMHAGWDWAESYLYSVPDSGLIAPGHLLRTSFHGPTWLTGGSVGPEASALLFILFAILWFLFDHLYPNVKYPVIETSQA